jgi:hypothetical protein
LQFQFLHKRNGWKFENEEEGSGGERGSGGCMGEGKGKWKEEEGEQTEFFAAFYEQEGIGMGRRERGDWGGNG